MDTPDPTLVGNNFIVRYYTVLNRNPDTLHHFYSNSSSRTFGHEEEETVHVKGVEVFITLFDSLLSTHFLIARLYHYMIT